MAGRCGRAWGRGAAVATASLCYPVPMQETSADVDFATRHGFDTRVGAYCVIIERDAILLTHLRPDVFDQEEWTLPGGGLELYETPEQAAVREVYEETGLTVELTGLLAVDSFTVAPANRVNEADRHRALLTLRIIYGARRVGGALRSEVGGSTDLASWVALDEVARISRVELVDVALEVVGR